MYEKQNRILHMIRFAQCPASLATLGTYSMQIYIHVLSQGFADRIKK